ncbi:MAG: zinc ribbon domain-containing protein [Ruminococcaceae bacterium]|nr:zinc ribbon domain-containing protein [Oscillospiraceae bacterium]
MALIKCPECNMTISDTTTQCVHCGYKIIKCIECGNIMPGNAKTCSNCGYEIKPSTHDNETPNSKNILFDSFKDMFESWWSNSFFRKIVASNNYLTKGAVLISGAFAFLGLIVIFLWKIGGEFDALNNFEDVSSAYNVLLAISAIFICAYFILKDFKSYFIITDLGNWAKLNNINLTFCIESHLNNDFGQLPLTTIASESKFAKYAILIKSTDGKQFELSNRRKRLIISSCMCFVSTVFAYLLLKSFTEIFMVFLLIEDSFIKYFISNIGEIMESNEFRPIIVLFVLTVASIITTFVYHKISLRKDMDKMDSWASKNIPHHLKEYNKYIKNVDTFIKNTVNANANEYK